MPPPDKSLSAGNPRVERLLQTCLEGPRDTWATSLERTCAEHPDLAEELERRFAQLVEAGLISDDGGRIEGNEEFGDYRLTALLGGGAMGVVYAAWWKNRGMPVALKMLRPGKRFSSDARRRFQREMQLAGRIEHPAICPVYDVGEHEGMPYIAMRLIEGETFAQRVERLPPPGEEEIANLLEQVEVIARALHLAHEQGLVHRDIKPANVMITEDGAPMLLDFGLARQADGDSSLVTGADVRIGTPAYMSPEACDGEELDRRSDVYSLAATLYECLTKKRPYRAATTEGLMRQIRTSGVPDPGSSNPAVAGAVSLVVRTALAKRPDDRYQSAEALAEDLANARRGKPLRARKPHLATRALRFARRRPGVVAGFASVLVGAVGMTWFLFHEVSQRRLNDAYIEAFKASEAPGQIAALSLLRDALQKVPDSNKEPPIRNFLRDRLVGFHDYEPLNLPDEPDAQPWAAAFSSDGERLVLWNDDGIYFRDGSDSTFTKAPWRPEPTPDARDRSVIPVHGTDDVLVTWAGGGEPGKDVHLRLFAGGTREPLLTRDGLLSAALTPIGIAWIEEGPGGLLSAGVRGPQGAESILQLEESKGLPDKRKWRGGLVAPNSGRLFAWESADGQPSRLWAWDGASGRRLGPPATLAARTPVVVVNSSDGEFLLTSTRFRRELALESEDPSLAAQRLVFASLPVETAQLWALEEAGLKLRRRLDSSESTGPVFSATISDPTGPHGKRIIAAVHADWVLRLWDADGHLLDFIDDLQRPRLPRFRPDSHEFLVLCRDSAVRVFDGPGKEVMSLDSGLFPATAFQPGRRSLVTCSGSKGVRQWDMAPYGQIQLPGATGGVSSITTLSPKGICITTSCGRLYHHDLGSEPAVEIPFPGDPLQQSLRIVSAATYPESGHLGALLFRSPSSEGQFGAISGRYEGERWLKEGELPLPAKWESPWEIGLSRDGERAWVGTASGLFELSRSGETWSPSMHPLIEQGAWTVSANTRRGPEMVVVGTKTGFEVLWTGTSDEAWSEELALSPTGERVARVSPEGNFLAVTGGYPSPATSLGQILLYPVDHPAKKLSKPRPLHGDTSPVSQLAFSPHGDRLASGDAGGLVCVWRVEPSADEAAEQLRGHKGIVRALCFSEDGRYLISGDEKGLVLLWPLETDDLLAAANEVLEGK